MTHPLMLALVLIPFVFQPHTPIVSVLFLGREGVDTSRMLISFGLASSTTVRVVDGIHGDTSDSRAYAKPSDPAGLSILDVLMRFVAHDADGGTNTTPEFADLTAGKLAHGIFSLLL